MKIFPAFIVAVCMLSGCGQSTPAGSPAVKTDSGKPAAAKIDFSHIELASKKDLACGMPLSAGLEDTAIYKGKIYGFCSKECKEEFKKNPESALANAK